MSYREDNPASEDPRLVAMAREGDRGATEALLRHHAPGAYAFALRLARNAAEAEDLSQTALIKAYRGLKGFRGESGFRTWLFRILLNEFRSRRRGRREAPVSLSEAGEVEASIRTAPGDRPDNAMTESDLLARVADHVAALPDRQREALTLLVNDGRSYAEIAAILGCSYDAVKVHISLARKKLREALKDYLEEA
jgi:RNA polymerase sigma-70 factor (ECF subfamily)